LEPTPKQFRQLFDQINYDKNTKPFFEHNEFHFYFKGKEYFVDKLGQWHLCEKWIYGAAKVLLSIGLNFDDVISKINDYLKEEK
jgi:hypothetical protein